VSLHHDDEANATEAVYPSRSGRDGILRQLSCERPTYLDPGHAHRRPFTSGREQESDMSDPIYPPSSAEIARERRALAPDIHAAFDEFSRRVFADGALPVKTKQLIAVAVAHVTQCPYCIKGHTKDALRHGATRQELMEAIWVAAEMRAGGAYAHAAISLATMSEEDYPRGG
jgi:AhpD family alkylhydroperoxidase